MILSACDVCGLSCQLSHQANHLGDNRRFNPDSSQPHHQVEERPPEVDGERDRWSDPPLRALLDRKEETSNGHT